MAKYRTCYLTYQNPPSTNNYTEELTKEKDGERPETKRGPGRPKIIRTGRPGRPRKSSNVMISNIEVSEEDNSVEVLDPRSLDEALEGPDAEEWTDAITAEIKAHMENDTWEIYYNV